MPPKSLSPSFSRWLLWFTHQSLVLVASGLMASGIAATTVAYPVRVAQQQEMALQEATLTEAGQANEQGMKLFEQGTEESLKQAIEQWEIAYSLFQSAGKQEAEAATLLNLGSTYLELSKIDQKNAPQYDQYALKYYSKALSLWQTLRQPRWTAMTLHKIGFIYVKADDSTTALSYYQQALEEFNTAQKLAQKTEVLEEISKEVAFVLQDIGLLHFQAGKSGLALQYLQPALQFWQHEGRRAYVGNVKTGKAHFDACDIAPNSDHLDDRTQEAKALIIFGCIRRSNKNRVSNLEGALSDFRRAQSILEKANNLREQQSILLKQAMLLQAMLLNDFGNFYFETGNYGEAINSFNDAARLAQSIFNLREQGRAFNGLGLIYSLVGENSKANDFLWKALNLAEIDERVPIVLNIFNLQFRANSFRNEEKQMRDILHSMNVLYSSLNQVQSDPEHKIAVLNRIGIIHRNLKEYEKSLAAYQKALEISMEVGSRGQEGIILLNIGKLYSESGNKENALKKYEQSLSILKTVGNQENQAVIQSEFAVTKRDLGDFQGSLTDIKTAINSFETLRAKIANSELRSSYFETKQEVYEFCIDLLMQLAEREPTKRKSYEAEALYYSERARARSLIELLTESRADIHKGVGKDLLDEEKSLQQKLDASEKELIRLSSNKETQAQVAKAQANLQDLREQETQLKDKIRRKSPAYAQLKYPEPLTPSQMQQQLDSNTLLLQYSLGEERSYLWVVSKTGTLKSYPLPGRKEIEQAANSFYSAVSKDGSLNDVKETGQRLSQLIKLDAIMPQLQGKKLLIAADGALHKVPFAALPNPKASGTYEPLVLEHEIINLPSISALAILRQTFNQAPAPKTLGRCIMGI